MPAVPFSLIPKEPVLHPFVICLNLLIVTRSEEHPVHLKVAHRLLVVRIMATPPKDLRGIAHVLHDPSHLIRTGGIKQNVMVAHLPHPELRVIVLQDGSL